MKLDQVCPNKIKSTGFTGRELSCDPRIKNSFTVPNFLHSAHVIFGSPVCVSGHRGPDNIVLQGMSNTFEPGRTAKQQEEKKNVNS